MKKELHSIECPVCKEKMDVKDLLFYDDELGRRFACPYCEAVIQEGD